MSTKDSITKKFLSRDDIFADAFNYLLFDGKNVIKPGDLAEQDPNEIAAFKKLGTVFASQKYRDVLKMCTIKHNSFATLVLLGIEAQSNVNYAMPVRDLLYDALNYSEQVDEIARKHKEAHDLKGDEYLSGFSGKDKIKPVITLCICFDKKNWDAPRSLYEMFGDIDPSVLRFVDDYRLNLMTPDEIGDFGKFSSELGLLMEFIHKSNDKAGMCDIIKSRKDDFLNVDVSTVNMINTYSSMNISTENEKGGHIDMCQAFQEILADERAEGRAENALENIRNLMKNMKWTAKQAMDALGITEEDRSKYLAKL